MLIDRICKKKPNDLCIDLEIILETDLTIVGFIYQGICRSFKGYFKKPYSKGSQLDIIHTQLQDEPNPSCPDGNANRFLWCGVKFSVTALTWT